MSALHRISTRALAVGLMAGALSACDFDRATVLSPLGDPSYDFRLAADGRGRPGGSVTAGTDTMLISLRGLEPLTGGVYQVWLANINGGALEDITAAAGLRVVVRTDTTFTPEGDPVPAPTTVDSTAGVSSFTQGGPNITVNLTLTTTDLGVDPTSFDVMIVSIEGAAGAAAPSSTVPLWARGSGAVTFGNFHPDPAQQYVFVSTGRGTAGIRGNIMIVDDSALARPPVGYYYATWVVKRDDTGAPIDTLELGEQTAPYPDRGVSLRDADTDNVHAVVLDFPWEILAASSRIELSGASPFIGFEDLWVTLENKVGDEAQAAPTIVLSGTVPTVVSEP